MTHGSVGSMRAKLRIPLSTRHEPSPHDASAMSSSGLLGFNTHSTQDVTLRCPGAGSFGPE